MSDQNSQRVAKNTLYLFLRMILVMGVSLFTSRVVLKTLGFEDFGIYNVVGSVVVFFSFLQAALRNATYRYLAFELGTGDRKKLTIVYSMAINSHLLLALFLFLLLEIGGIWFLNYKLNIPESRLNAANWAYHFSLLTFCLGIIRTPFESNIIAHEKMDFYAIISIFEVVAKLLIVYLLIIIPFDKLIMYAILMTAVYLLLSMGYYIYCKIKFRDCVYERIWETSILKQFCSYSGWSLLVNGACIVRTQSINIFFNLFLGVIANAALGIANQVVAALNSFVASFTQAFNPQIIKSYAANDSTYFYRLLFSTSKLSYYLLFIITLPFVLNVNFVLGLWLGDYPEMAPIFIETIILYYLIDAMQMPLVTAVHATGKLKTHQILISIIVFAMIPIAYLLLYFGLSGSLVLALNAICNLVCAIARTIYMKRLIQLDVKKYVKTVVLPIGMVSLFSVPIPIYLSFSYEDGWLKFIVLSIVSLLLSILIVYYMGLDSEEKLMLKKMPVISKFVK